MFGAESEKQTKYIWKIPLFENEKLHYTVQVCYPKEIRHMLHKGV